MRKISYILRYLFPMLAFRLSLQWLLAALTAFNLLIAVPHAVELVSARSSYLGGDMADLVIWSDAITSELLDSSIRPAFAAKTEEKARALPQVQEIYCQTQLIDIMNGVVCVAYPTELLSRLHIPSSQRGAFVGDGAENWGNPIWLDYRMRGDYSVGDTVSFDCTSADWQTSIGEVPFQVAGFLSKQNVYYDFQDLGTATPGSSNFLYKGTADSFVAVAVDDGRFSAERFASCRSTTKFILPADAQAQSEMATLFLREGLGVIYTMPDILEVDKNALLYGDGSIIVVSAGLFILTLIGIICMQSQLLSSQAKTAFSLYQCGMQASTWRRAWILLVSLPMAIAAALGASGGVWYFSYDPIPHPIAYVTGIALTMTALSILGILPTTQRWNNGTLAQIRRTAE